MSYIVMFFQYLGGFIVDFIRWMSVKRNRAIAFKYFRIGLEVSRKAAKLTNTKVDDKGLEYIITKFDEVTANMNDESKKQVAKILNDDMSGAIKDLKVDFDCKKKIATASVGPAGIAYNPTNGNIKLNLFGVEL
tara:strand:- start:5829 stop:6230 length:402 start_codon:yes stop_codon:yes gene_type:complete